MHPALASPLRDQVAWSSRVQALNDMRYRIDLLRSSGGDVAQSIEVRNGVDPAVPGGVAFVDVDNDGFADLRVLGGRTQQGDDWYKIWRFDPASRTFVWSHTTDPPAR